MIDKENDQMSAMRERIKTRMDACDFSMKKIDVDLGLSSGFMFDFLSGRKKTLKGSVLSALADKLKTTEIWILKGVFGDQSGGIIF